MVGTRVEKTADSMAGRRVGTKVAAKAASMVARTVAKTAVQRVALWVLPPEQTMAGLMVVK